MTKSVITKKECKELNSKIKEVQETNRLLAHKIMEIYFHYYGIPLTKEAGRNLPIPIVLETEELENRRKICSVPVYVLVDEGMTDIHYTNGDKDEWTAHGYFRDYTANLNDYFESKFILADDASRLNLWINKALLGIIDVTDIQGWCEPQKGFQDCFYETNIKLKDSHDEE